MEIIQLIEKIIDSDNWPYFSDADRLDELDELAEEAFRRKTFDGFLSYVFITHQICDELLKLLIVHTRFTLQLYLIPDGFNYKFSDKSDNKDLEGITTGKLIDILQNSLEFDKKEDFIQASFGLSQIRNRLAHELARSVKLERIEQSATKYRENYKELRGLFDIVHDVFCLFYKDEKKDDKWDFILEEYIGMLNADEDAKEIEVS